MATREELSRRLGWLACAMLAVACATPSTGWTSAGYEHPRFGWKATYPPHERQLLGGDWRLEAPTREAQGRPWERGDLVFRNARTKATIVIESEDLASDAPLDALVDRHIRARASHEQIEILERNPIELGGNAGTCVTYQSPSTGAARVEEVLDPGSVPAARVLATEFSNVADLKHITTALWFVTYTSDRRHFDEGLPDFVRLMTRLTWPGPIYGRDTPLPGDEDDARGLGRGGR